MPLVLQENFTVKLLEMLRTGDIDAAILAEPFPDTGLAIAPLYDEPFLVAVPSQHPLASRKSISSTELKRETMLLLGTGHCFRDHVLEVGRTVFVWRRAHGDALHGAKGDRLRHVGGEMDATRGAVLRHHFLQPGLVDRHFAPFQHGDLARVHVEAHHLVAHVRETGSRDQADVTASD